jgi:hypothetical protein
VALTKLAAAIAHDVYHVAHRPDEGPAYDEQIKLLSILGASRRVIAAIESAKAVAVGR